MPKAIGRLNLRIFVPGEMEPDNLVGRLLAAGVLTQLGNRLVPGPEPLVGAVPGLGFVQALWVDLREVTFLSCGAGFRVFCPQTGENLMPVFLPALSRWRATGALAFVCRCGQEHRLSELSYQPEAGFARWVLELRDCSDYELSWSGKDILNALWGPVRSVSHRG